MKHKILLSASIILTLFLFPATADGALSGMVRDYAAYRFEQTDLPVHEMTADLTYEYYTDSGKLMLHPVAYSNPNEAMQLSLEEAYFDFYLSDLDIRVGKQKVIWGEAEGAFITDLVSPRDMRSFILADFTEIRKAVPAIKVDYYNGDYTLEGIWVTHFIPSTLPSQDSLWAQNPSFSFPPAITTTTINEPTLPATTLENSEVFLSVGHFGSTISWKINGGWVYTDEPLVTKVEVSVPTATIFQGYERYLFTGGSFNTTLGSAVLRGEAALALDKPINNKGATITVEHHNQVQTLLGIDWDMLGKQWSAQYLLTYTHDYQYGLVSQMKNLKEYAQTFTFRVQETFFDERLTAKLFTYVELDPANALVRPSLSYNFGNGVLLEGGLELFLGDAEGTFGAYKDNSMAWASVRWYF